MCFALEVREKRFELSNNLNYVFFFAAKYTEGSDKNEQESVGDMFMNRFQNLLIPLLALAVFFSSFSFGSGDQQQATAYNLI